MELAAIAGVPYPNPVERYATGLESEIFDMGECPGGNRQETALLPLEHLEQLDRGI